MGQKRKSREREPKEIKKVALKRALFQPVADVELPDCCASGQVVPGQYDHCGCLQSCGAVVCAQPEGFHVTWADIPVPKGPLASPTRLYQDSV